MSSYVDLGYILLVYEQDYSLIRLSGLDYEDYSARLELMPNGVNLVVM